MVCNHCKCLVNDTVRWMAKWLYSICLGESDLVFTKSIKLTQTNQPNFNQIGGAVSLFFEELHVESKFHKFVKNQFFNKIVQTLWFVKT